MSADIGRPTEADIAALIDEVEALRAQVERIEAIVTTAENAAVTSLSRMFNGAPFPALIPADHLRTALDHPKADGWICEVCGCWNRDGNPCKYGDDEAHQAEEQ